MPESDGTVGVEEAAQACRVSDETIRRRLRNGTLRGAFRAAGPTSAWRIPIADLIAAGFTPSFDRVSDLPLHQTEAGVADTLRTAAAAAEAVAVAVERLERIRVLERHVADLQYVLRLLGEKS